MQASTACSSRNRLDAHNIASALYDTLGISQGISLEVNFLQLQNSTNKIYDVLGLLESIGVCRNWKMGDLPLEKLS